MDWRRDRDWDRSSPGGRGRMDAGGGWREDEDRYGREFRHGSNLGDENRRWQGGDENRRSWGGDENRRSWQGGERGFGTFGGRGFDDQGYGRGAYGAYGAYGVEQGWGRDRWEGRGMEDRDRNPPQQQHLNRYDWRGQQQGRGQFAGKGPRGYRRSDERIREDVCDALTRDPDVDGTEIEVTVQGGVVTLTGSVDDRNQKRMAENCIERVEGVHDVHNQLRVHGRDDLGRNDDARAEVKSGRNLSAGQGGVTGGNKPGGSERNA